MATSAKLSAASAIAKTFPAGSNERKALLAFLDGINVNTDREAARWVVKGWSRVLTTIKQTWGL